MFDIEYKGGNGLVITTKKIQVVIDPRLSVFGLKDLNSRDGVEIATEDRFFIGDPQAKLRINGPGEYEIADVSIKGVRATRHLDTDADEPIATIYRIEVGDVRIAVLGNVSPKLTEDQLEAIGIVDIVIIPVGGNGYTLDAASAATIVRQIDPRAVVPVHYADSSLKYEVPQDTLEHFVKDMAAPVEEQGNKYRIKAPSSIPQVLTVVKIDRS